MDRTEILQCSSLVVRVLSSEWQRRRSARFRAIQNNHTSPRLMAGLLRHRGEAGPILVNTCCDALGAIGGTKRTTFSRNRNSRVCRELVQQNLRLLEVRQIEALAERAVDRRQHRARLAMHSLAAPKLREARGGAQRERLLATPGRQIERLAKARLRAV